MTQGAVNISLQSSKIVSVRCEFPQRRIICYLGTDTFIVRKRTRNDAYIFLKKGKTLLKLKPEIYELVCAAQVFLSFARP